MDELSCKTPPMCQKELWAYMLAYNLIRLLMAEVAVQANALSRELSFKHTVQVWLAWSRQQFLSGVPEDLEAFFQLIAHVRMGNYPAGLNHGRSSVNPSLLRDCISLAEERAETSDYTDVPRDFGLNLVPLQSTLFAPGASWLVFGAAKTNLVPSFTTQSRIL